MQLTRALAAGLLLAHVAGGCAAADSDGFPAPVTHAHFNLLSHADLAAFQDPYEAVQVLRPQWLLGRSERLRPVVYLDGVRVADLDILRRMPARSVAELRFFSAAQAAGGPYGGGSIGGVLVVTTAR